jgi:hypothetical protein
LTREEFSMTVSYNPAFEHTDWVDNVDRVRAGGDNGFNGRFHALEDEFKRVAGVITDVGAALDKLSRTPDPTTVKMTLAPTLTTLADPWEHVFGGASKPSGATDASGLMAVTLPAGVAVRELRACGRKESGNLTVSLRRQGIIAGANPELVRGLPIAVNGNFDERTPPEGVDPVVDNEQFRYYLTAELDGANPASVVQLTCFQITYVVS